MSSPGTYFKDPVLYVLLAGLLSTCWFADFSFTDTNRMGRLSADSATFNVPAPVFQGELGAELGVYDIQQVENLPDGMELRYTFNGALPDGASFLADGNSIKMDIPLAGNVPEIELHQNSYIWKRPFDAPKKLALRAAFFKGEQQMSPVTTKTIGLVNEASNLPTIAISTHPDNLFGHEQGIYIMGASAYANENFHAENKKLKDWWWDYPGNYSQRGRDWEREAHFEYFDEKGVRQWESGVGIRINGNATRAFPRKSLRVYSREEYDPRSVDIPLFSSDPQKSFSRFLIRNGGNDWHRSLFRDAFAQALFADGEALGQRYEPVIVYLNGVYWGIHNIRDRFSDDYFMDRYQVDPADLVILEKSGELDVGTEADVSDYRQLIRFARENDLSDQANYQQIGEQMDIVSFADFILAETYVGNTDWPINNVRFYRIKDTARHDLGAGRWRWMIYDLDYGLGYTNPEAYSHDMFQWLESHSTDVTLLFKALCKQPDFRNLLSRRAAFFLNGRASPEKAESLLHTFESRIEPEMERHIQRWRKPKSVADWKQNVAVLRKFVRERPAYFQKHLEACLGRYQ